MPDWSYRTVFRPLLFRVPEPLANRMALGVIGFLGRSAPGRWLIDLFGHMRADPRLRRRWLGFDVASPIGIGPVADPEFRAAEGLARFGVGFLEIGPVTPQAVPFDRDLRRAAGRDGIVLPRLFPNPGLDGLVAKLERAARPEAPLIFHLAGPALECEKAIARLAPFAAAFALDAKTTDDPPAVVRAIHSSGRPFLSVIPADCGLETALRELEAARADGVIVNGSVTTNDGLVIGEPARSATLALVRQLRSARPELPILAGGGVHEPADALALLDAGADLIRLDSGLIYGGPGLPKRCNEAILSRLPPAVEPPVRVVQSSWFWAILLGSAMLGGGLLALIIAATRVILPYDESFCGISREQFAAINRHLLAFMAHDRVSLAGTMVAVGVSYIALGGWAIRRGRHWAWIAVLTSALAGFASFFLFLGFGYFDPFHAFVTATLFPLLLQIWAGHLGPPRPIVPDLREDPAWRRSQWAQLAFVIHGAGVLGAGFVISGIGATSVFVPEDLQFMGTTADALRLANPRLVPLVAHDRASFGGMLISSGLILLLTALWGWRRGERWLWWMYLLGFGPAYAAAIGVHLAVGYTDFHHLTPAMSGAALLSLGLWLGRDYLTLSAELADSQNRPIHSSVGQEMT